MIDEDAGAWVHVARASRASRARDSSPSSAASQSSSAVHLCLLTVHENGTGRWSYAADLLGSGLLGF